MQKRMNKKEKSGITAGHQKAIAANSKFKIIALVVVCIIVAVTGLACFYGCQNQSPKTEEEDYNQSVTRYDSRAKQIVEAMIKESHNIKETFDDYRSGTMDQETALAYLRKEKRNMEAYLEHTKALKDSDYTKEIKRFGKDCLSAIDDSQAMIEKQDQEAVSRAEAILNQIDQYQKDINAARTSFLEGK